MSLAESRAAALPAQSIAAWYLAKSKAESKAESNLVRLFLSPTDFARYIVGITKQLKSSLQPLASSLSPPASRLKPHLAK